ncbi:MAG: hypothetical protein QM496_16555 [Verrucomicrobiota bacterium]
MIRVDRKLADKPNVLSAPDTKGKASAAKETRLAKESLEKWEKKGKDKARWSYNFKLYKHEEVKGALTKLFHGKCAYCETLYAATQPMDVEHWRPKGRVKIEGGGEMKPAYYWLAAEWDNLLPSCIDCNRERKQEDAVSGNMMSLGKKDRFPIQDENYRATGKNDLGDEVPLLLHPCKDDPGEVLQIHEKEAVFLPVQTSGLKGEMAIASIEVYGLNRSGLVLNRREHLRIIELNIATIKSLAKIMIDEQSLPKPVELAIEEVMLASMKQLVAARGSSKPYAMMARQIIQEKMSDFGDFFDDN